MSLFVLVGSSQINAETSAKRRRFFWGRRAIAAVFQNLKALRSEGTALATAQGNVLGLQKNGDVSPKIQIALKRHIATMAQSLASIVVHIIFSTKARQPVLIPEIRPDLYAYLASIAKNESAQVYEIGGIEDHVHALIGLPRTMPLSKLVEIMKKESSKWLKRSHPALSFFSWQNGYGAFSVSASKIPVVRNYIREQEKHHKGQAFREELIEFLKTSNVSFDEKYLWD